MLLKYLLSSSLIGLALSTSFVFDSEDHYNVSWTFTDKDITFTIVAETRGWIGLGFSPSGSMAGSDLIIGWVDNSGKGILRDCFGTENSLPNVDDSQNVELLTAGESNGVTTLTFKRKLDTGDQDDNVIRSDTTRLIWAYGLSDPQNNSLSDVNYHGTTNRGSKSIYLLDKASDVIKLPADSKTMVFRELNVTIPAADTTYWCSWHKMPTFTRKQHILMSAPELTPGNEAFVHHILIYECHGVTHEEVKEHGGKSAVCYTAEMPNFAKKCSSVMLAWAIGGEGFYYPEKTGYPLGPGTNSPDYVLMEIHYDNPNLIEGVVDSSGLSIKYSPTLRENDIGLFEVGVIPGIVVPPGDDGFKVQGSCHGDCTSQVLPEEGITVFSYFLHAHLLGAGIRVDHYRNGKLLGTIASDDYYDFNYQEWRLFQEPLKLLPGDSLETTCTMKSIDRTNVTYGGQGSREEMCVSFLNYYPALNLARCDSMPNFLINENSSLFTSLGVQPQKIGQYVNLKPTLAGVNWDQEKRDLVEKITLESPYHASCTGQSGHYYKMEKIYHRDTGEENISSSSSLFSNIFLIISIVLLKSLL